MLRQRRLLQQLVEAMQAANRGVGIGTGIGAPQLSAPAAFGPCPRRWCASGSSSGSGGNEKDSRHSFNVIPAFIAGQPLKTRQTVIPCLSPHADGWDHDVVRGAAVKLMDNSALRLRRRAMIQWPAGGPSQVLLVKKPKSPPATDKLKEIAAWLSERGIKPYVERAVKMTECPHLDAFDPDIHDVDFCVTLGGDGTVLHLASLFEDDEPLPPVISFAMGTLGFLTPFDAGDFKHFLTRVLNSTQQPLFCTLRTRKRCELRTVGKVYIHNVLNEVVIDRGASPSSVLLELFADGHYVTNIEADGLIIATPSGSTAYSMSAGGPMVAPSVPCTILTPIAPHSLSFRPLVIPESSDIIINLPSYARSIARCSFDGKNPLRMQKESSVKVTTSLCPLPMINMGTLDSDWYEGITQKLKWNQSIRAQPTLPRYATAPIAPSPATPSLGRTPHRHKPHKGTDTHIGGTYDDGEVLRKVTRKARAATPSDDHDPLESYMESSTSGSQDEEIDTSIAATAQVVNGSSGAESGEGVVGQLGRKGGSVAARASGHGRKPSQAARNGTGAHRNGNGKR